jgi:hypothetical protein
MYQQGIASNNATYPPMFPSSLLSMSLMNSVLDDDNDAVLDIQMPNIVNRQRIICSTRPPILVLSKYVIDRLDHVAKQ